MNLAGRCHCENIQLSLLWTPEPTEIPGRACSCSFCTSHAAVWTACTTGRLDVTFHQPSLVTAYRFGTRTADFHICTRCGVVPVVTCRIDGVAYGVVNVNVLDASARALVRRTEVTHDETTEQRLARRCRNWIPDVRGVPSPD